MTVLNSLEEEARRLLPHESAGVSKPGERQFETAVRVYLSKIEAVRTRSTNGIDVSQEITGLHEELAKLKGRFPEHAA